MSLCSSFFIQVLDFSCPIMQTGPHHAAEEDAFREENNKVEIYPRGFKITWGNDERYWKKLEGEIKCEAELKQVSWLEVACSTKVESGKTYKVGFEVSLKPDAFGWKDVDVYVMAKVGKSGKYIYKKFQLHNVEKLTKIRIPDALNEPLKIKATTPTSDKSKSPKSEVTSPPPDKSKSSKIKATSPTTGKKESPEIHFGLYEVWNKKWKGGLIIKHAFIEETEPADPKNESSSS
ncbi:protein PHLOEM PROTEIN 2-LIKE A9-like isoform X2 [Cucurbita moschata]|uniref:Protein PHLOEM PROTEIN 2-LIKE A9-like isoform X2 n=1 Tax=Cucurbita moschata TaxID=3662 RepID=A0A6J1GT21_CUCMO|nr:protein PHLOEM PROTEIN 2-LIKE A9-like isoform X2 [Cucurbita moschata]